MHKTIINCETLHTILNQENIVIIDTRHYLKDLEKGQNEYNQAHIPNAFYAHLDHDLSGEIIAGVTGRHPFPSVKKIVERLESWGIDETKQVVVYDQSHGGIAARLWMLLNWLGHENVAVLNGGWQQWQRLNLPTNNNIPTATKSTFSPTVKDYLLVNAEAIEANIQQFDFTLIDARAAARYRGEIEPIDPVAGHIPTALSFPFIENLDDNHLFISDNNLSQRFQSIENEDIVIYCGSGVTACHNILALKHIGKTDVRLYPGSWSDWIVDERRSIVS
ncbi:MAG: sulfurtransferase [Saprospiraceae bacterium]